MSGGEATRERLERVVAHLEALVEKDSAPEAVRLREELAAAEVERTRLKAQHETAARRLDAAIVQLRGLLGEP